MSLAGLKIDSTKWSPGRVTIIGAGLLGGSFGLAIRDLYRDAEVIGVSRSKSSRDAAVESRSVTSATDDVEAACDASDLVVVAVPVDAITEMVIRAVECCSPDALVIDLGSTKATIVRTIDRHDRASQLFVGTHPIAGSEKSGAQHARANLFVGKTVILTPGAQTPRTQLQRAEQLWQTLFSKCVHMTPEDHDVALASISHVPHIVASMLASLIAPQASPLVGTGWIDTTRVASGDAELWTAICQENGPAILQGLQTCTDWLSRFSEKLQAADFDAIRSLLAESKTIRDAVIAARPQRT